MARKPRPSDDSTPRPPRRRRFNLQKALFVLPNAFTASSIFCGFFAILRCTGSTSAEDLYRAAIAIFFGMLFDMFDGRVARLTKTQSEFGREFDSLADVITFGVAPGVLVYKWALSGLGTTGMVLAFVYTACGAIRLARFNVIAARETGPSLHFIGLPIPLAAGALVSLVIANHQMGTEDFVPETAVTVIVVVLSFLMVSTVRYRTFKDLKLNKKGLTLLGTLALFFAAMSYRMRPSAVMALFVWGYLLVGMLEEVVFFRRRRLAALASQALQTAPAAAPPAHAADDAEEEHGPRAPAPGVHREEPAARTGSDAVKDEPAAPVAKAAEAATRR